MRGEGGQCPDARSSRLCYELKSNGHLYYSSPGELNHKDAAEDCHSLGGYLATLISDEEVHLGSGMSSAKGSWIGLELNRDKWQWANDNTIVPDGSDLWSPGYQSRERCAAVDRRGTKQNAIRKDCSSRLHYICEFDSYDESSKACYEKKVIHVREDYREMFPSVQQCLTSFGKMGNATEHVSQTRMAKEKLKDLKGELLCDLGEMRRTEELLCCNDCAMSILDPDARLDSGGTLSIPVRASLNTLGSITFLWYFLGLFF